MKSRVSHQKTAALTLIEVLVIVLVLAIIAAFTLPAFFAARRKNLDLNCQSKLNEIGHAFLTWESDHNGKLPTQVSVANDGAMEMVATGNVAACFQAISNGLSSPKVLICPTEKIRHAAVNFSSGFDNSNISYFVGLDVNTNVPQAFLSGDDNFSVRGIPAKSGLLELSTNMAANSYDIPVDWTEARHAAQTGNILFTDGSIHETYYFSLRDYFSRTGLATNRLAIP